MLPGKHSFQALLSNLFCSTKTSITFLIFHFTMNFLQFVTTTFKVPKAAQRVISEDVGGNLGNVYRLNMRYRYLDPTALQGLN